ncbi:hypothetical protein ALC56_12759 [Trachymyrmex septentrionalis]|uniref:Uncharacterized protein n=1 Tax=Trachymyrmex septentrionalis TaxID=34720 RepID=A0A195EXJ2_9HYME|nr:hypothetical protein ALC56_12759 [Trachymyrmex septentrionalis]
MHTSSHTLAALSPLVQRITVVGGKPPWPLGAESGSPQGGRSQPVAPSRITTDCLGSLWAIYGDGDDRQRDIRKPDSGGSSATLLEEQSTCTEGAGRIASIPQ